MEKTFTGLCLIPTSDYPIFIKYVSLKSHFEADCKDVDQTAR